MALNRNLDRRMDRAAQQAGASSEELLDIAMPARKVAKHQGAKPRPLDVRQNAELLVEAIIQVESAGNSRCVGSAGERGLMQIKQATWREVTQRLFGKPMPFDRAFDPKLNRRTGKAYLAQLQLFLHANRKRWKSDERSLLLAAYNAGPDRVLHAGFDLRRLPEPTLDYIERATALHEYYLADDALRVRRILLACLPGVTASPGGS